jgi:transcriptional regulator GlxA family with amidase domain
MKASDRSVTVARTRGCAFSVAFVLQPNFTLLPFAAIMDAFRLAADDGDGSRPINCRWTIVAPDLAPIIASCGVEVRPWERFGDPARFDYIIVVGGLLHRARRSDEATIAFLREADRRGVTLVGVCTGTFTLARANLMTARRCCVSWFHYDDLVREFPDVTPVADRLFVVDRKRITCAGGAGAVDLAAWIIERHLGRAYAQKSLHIMVVDHGRTADTPQPQPPLAPASKNERVRRAMLFIEQHMSRPLAVDDVARHVSISKRQLERLFRLETGMAVQAFSRMLRLRYGLWCLAQRRSTINEIAGDCGFADASHFSRLVRRSFGLPPSVIRRRGRNAILAMLVGAPSVAAHKGFASPRAGRARQFAAKVAFPNERRPYTGDRLRP